MKKTSLFGSLAVLALFGAGCVSSDSRPQPVPQPQPEAKDTSPVKLGWVGPLTGDAASLGKDAQKAAELAVEEVNAAGGINGRQLQLIVEDGKCNAKEASDAGNKLMNADQVKAIVGGACSGETTAIAPMAEQNKVVLFSFCSSAPNITTAGEYIFRSYPSDAFQGKVGAEYAYNKMGKKKVAVFATLGDWGTGLKNTFLENFKALGGEVVLADDFNQDTRDFKAQITKLKNSGADLIYFPSYTEAAIAFFKQAKELGLKIPVLGGDATGDDPKLQQTGYAEGLIYTVASSELKDASWKEKLKAKGGDATACAPRSYDNVKILAEILKRVGPDAIKIKDELSKLKDYQGVAGSLTLDQNGDPTDAKYDVKLIKEKKAEVIDQL